MTTQTMMTIGAGVISGTTVVATGGPDWHHALAENGPLAVVVGFVSVLLFAGVARATRFLGREVFLPLRDRMVALIDEGREMTKAVNDNVKKQTAAIEEVRDLSDRAEVAHVPLAEN